MADFGLAAQIGRGNAMPGAQQQQDPQNRMMQMMQLQQLQQNMMLARDQEARAAGLYGLQRGTLEETLNNLREREKREAGAYVPELAGKVSDAQTKDLQRRMQLVQTNLAEGAFNVKTRLLKLRSSTEPEVMLSPNFRKSLMGTDPELAVEIDRLASEGEKTGAEIQKAGYDRDTAKLAVQKAVVSSIADNLGGVVDQQTFSTVLNELEKVDPLAPKLIGTRFNDVSLRKLGMRLRGLKNYELRQKPSGEWERIDINAAESSMITPAAPAASQLGNLDAAQASNPSSPQLIGAGAAGLASTPGGAEMPIIGQRALPPAAAAPPPGISPKAEAVRAETEARERAQAIVKKETQTEEQQKGRADVAKTIANMTSLYDRLNELKGIPDERGDFGANAVAYLGSTAAGQTAEKMLATRAQTQRNAITSAVRVLISDMKKATGMSAQELNNIKELELMLEAASNPSQSIQSVQQILSNLNERYGDGKPVTFKSLSAAPDNTPPRRGAAAPAAAAPAAAPAGGMTPQERTEAMNWLRANPNDPRAATIKQRLGVQ
jgi:hypothetical protein